MFANSALTHHRLAMLERALFALAAVLLGWCVVQQATTVYHQAAMNREPESMRMPVVAPARHVAALVTGALVGRVQVPRLGVSAMIREGDDASTLRDAVGHIPMTALPGEPGNCGLAGHRDTFFRGLRNIRPGDRITVTTPRDVLEYVVRRTRIVEPDDVAVLNPTPGQTLTLVTCYPFSYIGSAPKRFIVSAERTGARP